MIGQNFDHKGKPKTETHNAGLTSNVFYVRYFFQPTAQKQEDETNQNFTQNFVFRHADQSNLVIPQSCCKHKARQFMVPQRMFHSKIKATGGMISKELSISSFYSNFRFSTQLCDNSTSTITAQINTLSNLSTSVQPPYLFLFQKGIKSKKSKHFEENLPGRGEIEERLLTHFSTHFK